MKMIDKQIARVQKDLEKANKAIERNTRLMEKNKEKCMNLGSLWTIDEWYDDIMPNRKYSWEQYDAWMKWQEYSEEGMKAINRAHKLQKELDALTGKAEANALKEAEDARIAEIEARWFEIDWDALEKEWQEYKARIIAEAKADGIEIEDFGGSRVAGIAKSGKRFEMLRNNGWTERSTHCYTLNIGGETIFTSGDFGTAYRYLKH